MSELVLQLTDASFNTDVLKSEQPVLVDFWAEWCMPCRFVGPVVEAVAKDYSGQVKVGKVNVDDNPKTASQYGINSIPTLMLFKGGKMVDSVIGAVAKEQIVKMINKHTTTAGI
jgi:thioredoxin 1